MKIEVSNAAAVVKRALYLAFDAAGGPTGMGFLQDRGVEQTEDQVWESAVGRTDYNGIGALPDGRLSADYVQGRMLKLMLKWDATSITVPDSEARPDYQAWSRRYKTYADLIAAAQNTFVNQLAPDED